MRFLRGSRCATDGSLRLSHGPMETIAVCKELLPVAPEK